MKFGLYGLHKGSSVESETLARRARLAEAAGFESLWVGDHVALPADVPDVANELADTPKWVCTDSSCSHRHRRAPRWTT